MTTKTIECIDCGESVPYGRLSCAACGALLASVAGALRAPIRAVEAVESPEPEAVEEPDLARESEAAPMAELAAEPEPVAGHEAKLQEPEPVAAPEPKPDPEAEAVAEPEPTAEPEPEDIAAAVETPSAPAPDDSPWPPLADDEPVLEPRPYARQRTGIPDGVATSPAAYRPPTFALAAATAAGPSWAVGTAAVGGSGGSAAADSIAEPKDGAASETSMADRSVELAGWFVIAGAAMSVLGFLLPWSRVVIGSANTGGYFDMWGLASPSHLIVVAGLIVVLGLGIVPSRVPAWIRTGVLGLAAGGILIGLAWPYVVGPLGADVGLTLALVGGIALGVGGILGSWATRHASAEPPV